MAARLRLSLLSVASGLPPLAGILCRQRDVAAPFQSQQQEALQAAPLAPAGGSSAIRGFPEAGTAPQSSLSSSSTAAAIQTMVREAVLEVLGLTVGEEDPLMSSGTMRRGVLLVAL